MFKKAGHWIHDYLHALHKQSYAFLYRKPPGHYLSHKVSDKCPIILIPGIYEKWHFLKAIADPLSHKGHPIYVLEHLGYNTKAIHHSAELVRKLIDSEKLQNVVIIAHSKGGLIAKHLLVFNNPDGKVKKLVAIATPFGGSHIVKLIPHKPVKELHPQSEVVRTLQERKDVNNKIVSIFGMFDNHVWPGSSCFLDGAKNIKVDVYGHHKILFNKKVKEIIATEIEKV